MSGSKLTESNLWKHQIAQLQQAVEAEDMIVLQIMQEALQEQQRSRSSKQTGLSSSHVAQSGTGGSACNAMMNCRHNWSGSENNDRVLAWIMGGQSY